MTNKMNIVQSSGDIFADIGVELTDEEREKVSIALDIVELSQAKNLTEKQASATLDISRAEFDDIMRGKLDGFSIDTLIYLKGRLATKEAE